MRFGSAGYGKMAKASRLGVSMRKMAQTLLCGCKGKPSTDAAAGSDPAKPRIYELADVNKEMKEAAIQLESSPEDLRNFFKTHTSYQVCQDTSYMLVQESRTARSIPRCTTNISSPPTETAKSPTWKSDLRNFPSPTFRAIVTSADTKQLSHGSVR